MIRVRNRNLQVFFKFAAKGKYIHWQFYSQSENLTAYLEQHLVELVQQQEAPVQLEQVWAHWQAILIDVFWLLVGWKLEDWGLVKNWES